MPGRRLLALGLWLAVTTLATAVVWAGTSTVVADLTDRPAPVVAHQAVVDALQPGPPATNTEPGITSPGPSPAATSAVVPEPAGPAGSPAPGGTPGPTTRAPVATPTPTPAPTTTRPAGPPTTPVRRGPTASYSTAGGVVTVRCTGPFNVLIELVAATPSNGYAVSVASSGPYYVEVHFLRPGRDDPLWAYCVGQPMRAYGGPPTDRG